MSLNSDSVHSDIMPCTVSLYDVQCHHTMTVCTVSLYNLQCHQTMTVYTVSLYDLQCHQMVTVYTVPLYKVQCHQTVTVRNDTIQCAVSSNSDSVQCHYTWVQYIVYILPLCCVTVYSYMLSYVVHCHYI